MLYDCYIKSFMYLHSVYTKGMLILVSILYIFNDWRSRYFRNEFIKIFFDWSLPSLELLRNMVGLFSSLSRHD